MLGAIQFAQAVAAELDIETLSTEAEHFCGGGPVAARQIQGSFDAQPLDDICCFAYEFLQGNAANQFCELFNRSR